MGWPLIWPPGFSNSPLRSLTPRKTDKRQGGALSKPASAAPAVCKPLPGAACRHASLQSALRLRFLVTGPRAQKTGEILIHWRCISRLGEVCRRIQSRENRMHDLRPGHTLLAVPRGDVAGPKLHVIHPRFAFHSEVNDRMPVFRTPDFRRPENFHEI